jgi:hypothetical protein
MSEYFDPTFIPNINRCAIGGYQSSIYRWKMNPNAQPVPIDRQARAAVWFGERLTRHLEFPVIVVVSETDREFSFWSSEWYCGVAHRDEVLQLEDPLVALLDVADIAVPHAREAVVNLDKFLPKDSFPSGSDELPETELLLNRDALLASIGEPC